MLFTTIKMKDINKRKIPGIILLQNTDFRENKKIHDFNSTLTDLKNRPVFALDP
jgi:hypothetical protein